MISRDTGYERGWKLAAPEDRYVSFEMASRGMAMAACVLPGGGLPVLCWGMGVLKNITDTTSVLVLESTKDPSQRYPETGG